MENEISIREATLEDIPTIQRIAEATFPLTYKDIITPEQNDYMMDMMYSDESLHKQMSEEHHTYLLAIRSDKDANDSTHKAGTETGNAEDAIGYVSVQPIGEDVYDLQKIYVLPTEQGHHIGNILFDSAVNWIKQHHKGTCHMELHVNRHNRALGFYKHKGMRLLRQGDYDIGNGFYMNDYIMGLDIK